MSTEGATNKNNDQPKIGYRSSDGGKTWRAVPADSIAPVPLPPLQIQTRESPDDIHLIGEDG